MRRNMNKLISSPENLELVLDNLKEGVIAHDLNRRVFFFNPVDLGVVADPKLTRD